VCKSEVPNLNENCLHVAGRFESIMISAPPLIRWSYNVTPQPGSPEEALVSVLQSPRDWA